MLVLGHVSKDNPVNHDSKHLPGLFVVPPVQQNHYLELVLPLPGLLYLGQAPMYTQKVIV